MGFDLPEGDGQSELPDPSSISTPVTFPRDVTSTPSAFPAVSSRVLEQSVCWANTAEHAVRTPARPQPTRSLSETPAETAKTARHGTVADHFRRLFVQSWGLTFVSRLVPVLKHMPRVAGLLGGLFTQVATDSCHVR